LWEVGDAVVPLTEPQKSGTNDNDASSEELDCFGRIVPETKEPSPPGRSRGRKSETVLVEFTDPAFGRAVGAMNALEDASDATVEVRRVPIEKLQHSNGGVSQFGIFKSDFDAINKSMSDAKLNTEVSLGGESSNAPAVVINSRLRARSPIYWRGSVDYRFAVVHSVPSLIHWRQTVISRKRQRLDLSAVFSGASLPFDDAEGRSSNAACWDLSDTSSAR
jgi:hypothetical protein